MADVEEDIDIDIDIDGEDQDEQPGDKLQDSKIGDEGHKYGSISAGSESNPDGGDYEAIRSKRDGTHAKIDSYTDSIHADSTLTDHFQIPDWVSQDAQVGFEAADMDERSRAMIESMLAEEEFYSGRSSAAPSAVPQGSKASHVGSQGHNTLPATSPSHMWPNDSHKAIDNRKSHDSRKRKSSDERSGQTKRTASEDSRLNAKLSSADLPSHNTRWTAKEDERLRQGINIHGYGNWKAIAAVVGTRNALQVKNHARHLAMSEKGPHDASTNTSDGEGLDRRSSAANSAEEDTTEWRIRKRRPRSKHVKRIDASAGLENTVYASYGRQGHRARSITSESGNEEFTGSEFGATSGYDTDNDEDRSTSKSPSLSAKAGSRSGSVSRTTPSPGLRPLFASLPLSYPIPIRRTETFSMDEDEDIDVDVGSSDEESSSRLSLSFVHKSKARSISPFSNSSTRSRLSSEFDSDSDRDLDDEGGDGIAGSVASRKPSTASSPALSDILGSSSDPYTVPSFNPSTSSANSTGVAISFKPLLKDAQYQQQQQQQYQRHYQHQLHNRGGALGQLSLEKMTNSPKERRTVSFGAVHVAELKPDLNSYDEDDLNSSEDGGRDSVKSKAMDIVMTPSPLSGSLYQHTVSPRSTSGRDQSPSLAAYSPTSEDTQAGGPSASVPHHTGSIPSNGGYLKKPRANQESEEDDDDEGSLGTGAKPHSNAMSMPSLSRKAYRAGAFRQKQRSSMPGSSGHSVSFQHLPTIISPGQSSIAPTMTSTAPSVSPRILDKSIITEEERQVHSEFFCNKASKTPERYQRIRNTIIQAWERSPSTYLTKTSVRSGLKDCGDVNAIGRVHSWLESIGAINVGMTASSPGASLARPRNGGNNSAKRRGHSEERGWSSSSSSSAPRRAHYDIADELDGLDAVWVTPPLRRRRVRGEKGDWVDAKDLEGRVIEHSVHINDSGKSERHASRRNGPNDDLFNMDDDAFFERHGMTKDEMEEELEQERLIAQNAKYFAASELLSVNTRVPKNKRAQHLLRQTRGFHEHDGEGDEESSGGYDPFRLVPLRKYDTHHPAPFRVKVSSDAMLIMDFHSHMAETEVIGLLGGLYDEDERILFVLGVFPCRSISTGLQCEMDPESDVEARYFFSSKGFVVVGWYHSHPTFEPNPSIRDIENQCEHQAMFRRHGSEVEPFVGVIVSPFDPRNFSLLSKFQFLTVSEQYDERLNCRLPFGFDREITRTNELSVSVFQQLSELVRYYRTYEHQVDLSQLLRKGEVMTRLEKLLASLNHHIFVDESTGRAFLTKVKELLVRGFHLITDRDPLLSMALPSLASSTPSTPSTPSPPVASPLLASRPAPDTGPSLPTSMSPSAEPTAGALESFTGPVVDDDGILLSSEDPTGLMSSTEMEHTLSKVSPPDKSELAE